MKQLKKAYEKIKDKWVVYCIVGIVMACIVYGCLPFILEKLNLAGQVFWANPSTANEMLTAEDGVTYQQRFQVPCAVTKEIQVHCSNIDGMAEGKLIFEFWSETENKQFVSEEWDMKTIGTDEQLAFTLPDDIGWDSTYTYYFLLTPRYENESRMAFYVTPDNGFETSEFYADQTPLVKGLGFALIGSDNACSKKGIFLVLLCIFACLIMLMCYRTVDSSRFDTVNRLDLLFVAAAVLSSALLLNQGFDVSISAKHSYDLLAAIKEGKFLNFYSLVLEKAQSGGYSGGGGVKDAAYYNIFIYLIMGIWLLPYTLVVSLCKLQVPDAAAVLYFNIFLIGMVAYSVYLVYHLAKDMAFEKERAIRAAYIYVTSITLMFSTLCFSQLDIIYIVIMLIALRHYLKRQFGKFSLIMSVAIMLKVFPILIFVPLILLVEKRLPHIIKYMVYGMSSTLVYKLLSAADPGYAYTQKEMGSMYNFVGRVFTSNLTLGMGSCAFLIFIMVILCVWCFDHDVVTGEEWKYIVTVPLVAFGSFAIFLLWHPEWLAMLCPFMALAIMLLPAQRSLLYCDWGIGILAWLVSGIYFPQNVDNYMVNWGVLPFLTGHSYSGISINSINKTNEYTMLLSALVALIAYFCFCTVKKMHQLKSVDEQKEICLNRGLVLVRCATLYMLIMLYICMYFYVG